MKVEILNLYSNIALPNSNLIANHGQSFLLSIGKDKILMDVGASGKKLLHNMKQLNVNPDDISLLILSHGHYDHTGGLPEFLNARSDDNPLKILAHPCVQAERRIKIAFFGIKSQFPELNDKQKAKIKFEFETKPQNINKYIRTSGEITNFPYHRGLESKMQMKVDGTFSTDLVPDDISIYIQSKSGQIILLGCAHAGILNICRNAKESSKSPIKAILGGTHMVRYSEEQVLSTANSLINDFDNPDLYLNHCTDKLPVKLLKATKTLEILDKKYNNEKIKTCFVGSKYIFEL